MNTLRSPRVGLLHLAVAVCIGGAAVAQAPNFLSAAPAASFPAEIAANASDALLSLASGYKGEPMGPALPPMSTALLGIVNLPRGASTAASMGGTGTINDPYFNVQNPGFDMAVAGQNSAWKFNRTTICQSIDPVTVVVTGDRQHALLQPVYYSGISSQCSNQPNGCEGDAVRVQLQQGLINAGHCDYLAIEFDAKFTNPIEFTCHASGLTDITYLEIVVEEWVAFNTGQNLAGTHRFRIARSDVLSFIDMWRRFTYHAPRYDSSSVLRIEFNLLATWTACGGGGPIQASKPRFPVSVSLDNVELKSLPAEGVQRNKRNQVTSGCQSSIAACAEVYEDVHDDGQLFGLSTFADNIPHDPYAQRLCPVIDCRADLNFDGQVNAQDLSILLAAWGSVVSVGCQQRLADIDMDGQVGASDLTILLSAWGPCP